jgi:hypothetical protein
MKLFFVLSLIAGVQMMIYASFDGLYYLENLPWMVYLSMGNMGFSQAVCSKNVIDYKAMNAGLGNSVELHFQC